MFPLYVKALHKLIRRRVLGAPVVARDALLAETRERMDALGLELEKVLQVRPAAAKAVVLCRREDVGRCVFKFVSQQRSRAHGAAYGQAMARIRELDDDVFPHVVAVGPNYSLEEYIDGEPLHRLPPNAWERADLATLFRQVRRVCNPAPAGSRAVAVDSAMTAREVRETVSYYVVKSLRPPPRVSTTEQARVLHRLWRNKERFSEMSEAVLTGALELRVPRTLMIDDLGLHNVFQRSNGTLVVIDADFMRSGHWGFDCVWLLSTLHMSSCPAAQREEARVELCDDHFLGFSGGGQLMSSMTELLLEIRRVRRDRGVT